jgi:hypothetical protein
MRSFVFLALLMGGVALRAQGTSAASTDACALLRQDDIGAVQGQRVNGEKGSVEVSGGLRFSQCFFTTTDFAHSVSLTVIRTDGDPEALSRFWASTFHPAPRGPSKSGRTPRRKEPPRALGGIGKEAFWTGDPRTGSLYVLDGELILRISLGGVGDEQERIRRSNTLARTALDRLRTRS